MDEYEVYEKECKEIREINEELLELFEKDMMDKNLADKTINRHLSNVNFYINEYMLHEDATPMGDFFIRKCMWSTPASIKSTAASIKKFYKCMLDYGKIEKADYEFLCADIKEGMDEWRSACEAYNDPDQESPFMMFF